MTNPLQELLVLSKADQDTRGLRYTPHEIFQQPEMWNNTQERVHAMKPDLDVFFQDFVQEQSRQIVLSGAGTSEFAGVCVESLFRHALCSPAQVISSPQLVATPEQAFPPGHAVLLISFARSGGSPESIGAFLSAENLAPRIRHLVITCNAEGALACMARERKGSVVVVLDERANDRGLAMTSSLTSMVIAAQSIAHREKTHEYNEHLSRLVTAAHAVLDSAPELLDRLCREGFSRGVFLGDGNDYGAAMESHLKLQELTCGKVMCTYETFLGVRHGPEAVIDEDSLVVAFLSPDPFVRRYHLDLLGELREKQLGKVILGVGCCLEAGVRELCDAVVEYPCVSPSLASPVNVIVGQLLGLFRSIALGFKPDSPSAAGVINRVVKGVRVYDRAAYLREGVFRVIAES